MPSAFNIRYNHKSAPEPLIMKFLHGLHVGSTDPCLSS